MKEIYQAQIIKQLTRIADALEEIIKEKKFEDKK